jgi:hypothetical protein
MFPRPKEPETIWLHSFSAGRTYDNAYVLASLLVLHRDKPKARVPLLAVIARRLDAASPKATVCM